MSSHRYRQQQAKKAEVRPQKHTLNAFQVKFVASDKKFLKVTIKLTIGEREMEGCIDTGASVTCLSKWAYLELMATHPNIRMTHSATGVVTADGKDIPVIGEATIPVSINQHEYQVPCFVLDAKLLYPIMLGVTFQHENNMQLDMGKMSATIEFPPTTSFACLNERVNIPAFTECAVPAKFLCSLPNKTFEVERFDPLFLRFGITVMPGIVERGREGEPTMLVLANLTTKSVELGIDTRVATIRAFDRRATVELLAMNTTTPPVPTDPDAPVLVVNNEALTDEQECAVNKLINETYRDVFANQSRPSCAQGVRHEIDTGTNRPFNHAPRRSSQQEREQVHFQVQEMLKSGVIRPSQSPWASCVVLVKKKDGKLRFCVDYRALNKITKRDKYPLPRVDDSLSALQRGRFFSSLDLYAGYWQIPMDDASKEKTAFVCSDGLFEFNVMPFGLCNAPATFQRFMDAVLAGLKWNTLLVYLDDIIIFSPTAEQHIADLETVFQRLREANLKLNPQKCKLFQDELLYLGHVISAKGIAPNPAKVAAVLTMKPPSTPAELHTGLGICGYYRAHIENFATLCWPLYQMLHKDTEFKWTDTEQAIWDTLKARLAQSSVLRHPDFAEPFVIQTDASKVGLGAVLLQRIDGEERVIQFISRALHPAEVEWQTRELEALAIIWACETLRHYVVGYKFIVESDHHSLQWLKEATKPARLVRWACRLSEYEFDIKHRPGKLNQTADALSRLGTEEATTSDRADIMVNYDLTSPSVDEFCNVLQTVSNLGVYAIDRIAPSQLRLKQAADSELKPIIDECKNNKGKSKEHFLSDGVLYLRKSQLELLVVPASLVRAVLESYHTHPLGAHISTDRLYRVLKTRFFWPNMRRNIFKFCENCLTCAKTKARAQTRAGLLRPIKSFYPFQIVGVDIVICRMSSTSHRYILVVVDYFTNWVEAAPMKSMTAEELIRVFFQTVISRHGCPKRLTSDSGTQLVSGMVKDMCTSFNITKTESAPYHQQANGKVEKFIMFLKQALQMVTPTEKRHKWDEMIDHCLFAYRATHSRVLEDTPFHMLYGRDATLPQDLAFSVSDRNLRAVAEDDPHNYQWQLQKKLRTMWNELREHREDYQSKYKEYYDKNREHVEYKPGDKVLIIFDLDSKSFLDPRGEGPFTVIRKIDDVTYEVAKEDKKTTVHVTRMSMCPCDSENPVSELGIT